MKLAAGVSPPHTDSLARRFSGWTRGWFGRHGRTAAELLLVSGWALYVGRGYLQLDGRLWPYGREFGSQIISHHFWVQLARCGTCALWNGTINGGLPAFADVFGSTLTPLVGVTTLLGGVVAGAKISVVGSLLLAGIAQWWIAQSLRLGSVARVWSAMLVIVAGHLTARLEGGAVGLAISTATASMAFAAAFALGIHRTRRYTLLLALLGSMTIVAGQGYLQAALLGVLPAFLFFMLDGSGRWKPVWREYLLAFGLSLLLASVFLVPAIHFWSSWYKGSDSAFLAAQPLAYIPLNLVISDSAYQQSTILGKLPYPYLYNLFVGWLPVILALLCLPLARRRDTPALLCLATAFFLALFMASGLPLRWLAPILPFLAGFRHTPLFAGLAVPAILGLAAYGLDSLLHLAWPRIGLGWAQHTAAVRSISLAWLFVLPLMASLRVPLAMSQAYLKTVRVDSIYRDIDALATADLQWVAPPYGEHFWVEAALESGLKVANVVWAWNWRDRTLPQPRLIASRAEAPADTQLVGSLGDIPIYEDPGVAYASVQTATDSVACNAQGRGGLLTIDCVTDDPGQLVVQENAWAGWKAQIDGSPAELLAGQWLSVEAPPGSHQYLFHYLPWDVPLGAIISLAGLVLLVIFWVRTYRQKPARERELDSREG